MSIQTNIQEVRQRIAAACGECGRDPKEITLVGASKMNDAAACREAIAAGIDVLGENRVQEMTEKLSSTGLTILSGASRSPQRKMLGNTPFGIRCRETRSTQMWQSRA